MSWLLDTNVISEATKRQPSQEVLRWVAAQPVDALHTASLAIAEIRSGIERVADPDRRAELATWLEWKVRPFFGRRILEPDEELWMTLIRIVERARERRRTLPVADLVFAATAARHDLVVVTRYLRRFEGAGVRLLDPWEAAPAVRAAE